MIYFILCLYNIFQGRGKHIKIFLYTNNTLGQSQTCAKFLKMCVHKHFYLLFKAKDTNFYDKITRTCVFLGKQARNYISINFIASCKRLRDGFALDFKCPDSLKRKSSSNSQTKLTNLFLVKEDK